MPANSELLRLFFALYPGPQVRQHLTQLSGLISSGSGEVCDPVNLHLTLAFIGSADREYQGCLEAAAAKVCASRFELTLSVFGYFQKPRIVWVGPGESSPALLFLAEQLNNSLRYCGYTPERRDFKPHVTLKRKASKLLKEPGFVPIKWQVDDFCLMASFIQNGKTCYRVVRQYKLAVEDS